MIRLQRNAKVVVAFVVTILVLLAAAVIYVKVRQTKTIPMNLTRIRLLRSGRARPMRQSLSEIRFAHLEPSTPRAEYRAPNALFLCLTPTTLPCETLRVVPLTSDPADFTQP
jgi:hypothetical protein